MLHSDHYVLAALLGLAAISIFSCSWEQIHFESEKSKVQLDVRAFGIEHSAFTKAGGGKDPHRIVFKAFDSLGNASFNPSTGLALSDWKYVKEAGISSAISKKGASMGLYLFLTEDEQNINVTATAYNTEGKEIISHTLENVPMKRNRKTIAKGNFLTAGGSGTFTFSTDWDSEHDVKY